MIKNILIALLVSIVFPFYCQILYNIWQSYLEVPIETSKEDIDDILKLFDFDDDNIIENKIESGIIVQDID